MAYQNQNHRDDLLFYTGSDTNRHHDVGLLENNDIPVSSFSSDQVTGNLFSSEHVFPSKF